ncbi:endothelin-converting enzyme 2-like [Oculina patagonica]
MWTVINNFIKVMPQKYRDAYEEYVVTIIGNRTRHRWKECIDGMQSVLGMPLGLLFVDVAFDEGSKKTITQMTQMIKDEFIKTVDTLPWMSDETKVNAEEKANAIAEDIGYPSYIKNPSKLAAKVKELKVGDKLFENVVNAMAFSADQSYGSLDKPVDRDQWFLGPSQVNGYYSPRQNRIVFLAAILQPPFYNPNYPKYFNYGGIGMVIGHEITHGFDNAGKFFDKNGNVNNWWSLTSQYGFFTGAKCLSRQYSDFEVYGKKINGNQTLNENIADNGGIKLAYNAYKTLVEKEGTEGALPGLGLTEEQLFFVGFARPWCSMYKKKAALLQLETDSHTYPKYR